MWLALVLFFLVVFGVYYYLFGSHKQSKNLKGEFYNQFTGEWEQAQIESKGIDPSKIAKTENSDGLHNYSIIKGFFNQYDESEQILNIRATIAFTQNALFEPIDVKLSPQQTIYCVPEVYSDPNTGKNYSLQNLKIPVKDGSTLYVPGERIISFIDFIEKSNDLTFLLIQLTTDFDQNKTNYVQKIIITGQCD